MDPWTRQALLLGAKGLPAEERKFFLQFARPQSRDRRGFGALGENVSIVNARWWRASFTLKSVAF
jgi:hypothetical protein